MIAQAENKANPVERISRKSSHGDKIPQEFKKGRTRSQKPTKTKTEPKKIPNPKKIIDPRKITHPRIMVTFEDEPSYQFLLNDLAELRKLKPNSYLDLDYLKNFQKYRVHLYYQDDLRTRIAYWETKYPEISKLVELDDINIRVKIDQNNTLSKAIQEVHAREPSPINAENLIHDPPSPSPDEIQLSKKVKIMGPFGLPKPDSRKTKNELLSEVKNLRINLAITSIDLQTRTEENCQLQKDLEKTKNKMQALVDQQKSFKNFFHQFINNLSPGKKSQYEDLFLQFDQTCENGLGSRLDQEPDDFYIESPKSRDFSDDDHMDQDHINQAKALPSEQAPIDHKLFKKPSDQSERDADADVDVYEAISSSSSSFIKASDNEVKPISKTSPLQQKVDPNGRKSHICKQFSEAKITKMMKDSQVSDDIMKLVPRIRNHMIKNNISSETMKNTKNELVRGVNWGKIVARYPSLFEDLNDM